MQHPVCRDILRQLNGLGRIVVAAVLLLLATATRAGIVGEEDMVNLTLNDGLSGETVYGVMTDHNGYVWLATSGGVSVYNGKGLSTFNILDEQGQRLTVYDICEVGNCQIWAATEEGLYCLNHGEKTFRRMLPEVEHPTSLMVTGDTLYIGSQQGLQFYAGGKLERRDVGVSRNGLDNVVRQYAKGEDGRIWFLSRHDLNSYDPRTGKVTRHQSSLSDMTLLLSQFAYAGQGRFVVGTKTHGLFLCNLATGTTEHIDGVGNTVTMVRRSGDGHICVACDGTGAYLLDGKTLAIREQFNTEAEHSHRLPSNGLYCYHRDANGVNWFGFVRHGLAYTYYSGDLFRVLRVATPEGEVFTTEGINVRTYCIHGNDGIIGTQNGFYYVNLKTGHAQFYRPADLDGGHIVNTVVWHDGLFYIGTYDGGGLHTFDPRTMTLKPQTFSPQLDQKSIGDLKVGPDGRLWIGCTDGLFVVEGGKVQQHFTELNSHITGGLILSITFDASGNAWLTGANGCSLYSVRSREIVEASFPKGFFNHHPWMRGAQGHDSLVFMRTGPQTFYTNEQMTDFGELELPIAFADKWCRSFVDDMRGHYLLTSERGVFCFDYGLKEMIHFGYGEGLRGDMINDMGMDADGTLWVATSQGLFHAKVKDIGAWSHPGQFQIKLYYIRQGSDLLTPYDEYMVNETRRITLHWNFRSEVLQLKATLLDYSKQRGRLYEYRLDDGDWQLLSDGEDIGIRRLFLGRHQLEIRLAGAEETASVYDISVMPSFWAFFELFLLVLAVLQLLLWWHYRKNTKVLLSERNEMEEALIEMAQEEALLAEQQEEAEEGSGGNKYQQVKMTDEECADIVRRMRHYLETEQAYVNSDLKRADLARVLHVPVAKLSYVFSMHLNENYYEFVNRYRLERFKQLIAEGAYKRFTLMALSEQCGFRKSSFFSTFRKVEGMTPTEYLKKQNIKIDIS